MGTGDVAIGGGELGYNASVTVGGGTPICERTDDVGVGFSTGGVGLTGYVTGNDDGVEYGGGAGVGLPSVGPSVTYASTC